MLTVQSYTIPHAHVDGPRHTQQKQARRDSHRLGYHGARRHPLRKVLVHFKAMDIVVGYREDMEKYDVVLWGILSGKLARGSIELGYALRAPRLCCPSHRRRDLPPHSSSCHRLNASELHQRRHASCFFLALQRQGITSCAQTSHSIEAILSSRHRCRGRGRDSSLPEYETVAASTICSDMAYEWLPLPR